MFIHKSKRTNGRVYLTLMSSYRAEGKSKKKTVRSLGFLDELEKHYDDPIAYFQAYCDEQNAISKAERQVVITPVSVHRSRPSVRHSAASAQWFCLAVHTHKILISRARLQSKAIGPFQLLDTARFNACVVYRCHGKRLYVGRQFVSLWVRIRITEI